MSWYFWDILAQVKTLGNIVLEAEDNNTPEKILLNLVLILLGQNCTGKTLLQCCLNTSWTTLHRLIKSQCNFSREAPDNITQEKFCSLS